MSRVFLGETFTLEDVSKVTVAFCTEYFHPVAVCISLASYGALDFIIKGWPAAVRVEFVFRAI